MLGRVSAACARRALRLGWCSGRAVPPAGSSPLIIAIGATHIFDKRPEPATSDPFRQVDAPNRRGDGTCDAQPTNNIGGQTLAATMPRSAANRGSLFTSNDDGMFRFYSHIWVTTGHAE